MARTSKLRRIADEAMKTVRGAATALEKKVGQEIRRRKVRRALKAAAKTAAAAGAGLLAAAAIKKSRAYIAGRKLGAGKTARKVTGKTTRGARRVKRRAATAA